MLTRVRLVEHCCCPRSLFATGKGPADSRKHNVLDYGVKELGCERDVRSELKRSLTGTRLFDPIQEERPRRNATWYHHTEQDVSYNELDQLGRKGE